MSGPLGSSQWMYSSGAAAFYDYSIDQSLRLEQGGLEIVDSSNTGNNKTFTISMWFKRSELRVAQALFGAGTGNDATFAFYINSDDCLWYRSRYANTNGGPFEWSRQTFDSTGNNPTLLIRDPNVWYHIVVVTDTTRTGATSVLDYFDVYLNGVDITSKFTYERNTEKSVSTTYNDPLRWNTATSRPQTVGFYGGQGSDTAFLDGYIAEVHSVDGQALDETYFGEFKNGIWIPKEVSIADYGTRGFYFDFADSSNLGNDASSGGTEDYTANGVASSDQSLDSPTNNFCVFNDLDKQSNISLQEGGLKVIYTGSSDIFGAYSTFHMTAGKWYAEFRLDGLGGSSYPNVGITKSEEKSTNFLATTQVNVKSGATTSEGTSGTSIDTFANGDILGVAFDADNGRIYFSKNGTFGQSQDPAAGTGAIFTGLTNSDGYKWCLTSYSSRHAIANFGQDSTFAGNETAGGNLDGNGVGDFAYAPPSGFLALCTSNLPEPVIGPNSATKSDDHFNTVLYTGDGSTSHAITGIGHQPDMVWIKRRNNANPNFLNDSVRGATKDLRPDDDDQETTNNQYGILKSFDSDGFTVSVGSTNGARANTSGGTFIGWSWKAGGTANTFNVDGTGYASMTDAGLTDGSIALTGLSSNTKSGFSIVGFTGTGVAGTVAHGLASAPEMVIVKQRTGATGNWFIYNEYAQASGAEVTYLNLINKTAASTAIWNNTQPTNTVFSLGTGNSNNAHPMIAYCFHSVEGFCRVGTYTGDQNNYPNGTFVFTGFRPALVALKAAGQTSHWVVTDNKRASAFNGDTTRLYWSDSVVETAYNLNRNVELFSNGFMVHGASATDPLNKINQSTDYIYLAYAEAPLKYANAR